MLSFLILVGTLYHISAQIKKATATQSPEIFIKLLKSNLCSNFFKLLLDTLSLFLRNLCLKNLRSSVNKILCFLKSKSCNLTNNLDNLNLLVTCCCKLYIELCLLLSCCCACTCCSYNNTCCC